MAELVEKLGIDWKLLLSQGLNFFILLSALTFLVYRPLIRIMGERRKKIEFGLMGAEAAEKKLKEIEIIKSEKIGEAEKTAIGIIGNAEKNAGKKFQEIISKAEDKARSVLAEASLVAEHKKREELEELTKKAGALIKEAISKTVALDPKQIDEKLVNQAASLIKGKTLS